MHGAHDFADKLGTKRFARIEERRRYVQIIFQTDIVTLQTAIVDSESFTSFARMIIIISMTGRN